MDHNIIMLKDLIKNKDELITSLVSWDSNYNFIGNTKYINIYLYLLENDFIIYNPNVELIISNIFENNKLKLLNKNKSNNPLWLLEKNNINIRLCIINLKTVLSNSRILLNILNNKNIGFRKLIDHVINKPITTLNNNLLVSNYSLIYNKVSNMTEEKLENKNYKLYKDWYDLINIKKINTTITGIKIEIHGRLTKRKKASRTKKYVFLKGSVNKNSNISLIDKSNIRMKVINGSAGLNIYLSNKINILI